MAKRSFSYLEILTGAIDTLSSSELEMARSNSFSRLHWHDTIAHRAIKGTISFAACRKIFLSNFIFITIFVSKLKIMKKIAILSLFLVITMSVFAQSDANSKFFRFGMSVSTGPAWIKSNTDSLDFDGMRLGLGYGFIGEFSLADNFGFTSGFDVSYVGGKMDFVKSGLLNNQFGEKVLLTDTNTSIKSALATYKIQYLSIPLMLKMKTNEINYMTYFLRVGGSIGMRIGSKGNLEYTIVDGAQTTNAILEDIKLNDEINLFRASFNVGAGVEYSLGGSTSALAEISFSNGLLDVFKSKSTDGVANIIALKLGIIF